MSSSLPPEWRAWVQENLDINPRSGLILFLKLIKRRFEPIVALDAVGDFDFKLDQTVQSIAKVNICVLISSYRDPECIPTVEDLFEKALFPGRISVAILSQEDEDDKLILSRKLDLWQDQIIIRRETASISRGACWARHHCQKLLCDQAFSLQIDSHMRFQHGWDILLLACWLQCADPMAMLSAYPASYSPSGDIELGIYHGMAAKEFDKHGILLFRGYPRYLDGDNTGPVNPIPGAFISAGFLFGPSSFVKDVQYDPNLYFFGEEVSMSVRLWTHGYNIYHPNRAIVYHCWDRSGRPKHFSDHKDWYLNDASSKSRVRSLLGVLANSRASDRVDLGDYGLGVKRSLGEYEAWSGIQFSTLAISDRAKEGNFPDNAVPALISTARVTLKEEEVVVVDDFLSQSQYEELRNFLICSDYKHINAAGAVQRAWHLQDRFPLRSDISWTSKVNLKLDAKSDSVTPVATPIDGFMESVESFQAKNVPQIGIKGLDWNEFTSTAWLYPPGTGLAMHTDGSNVYAGAYVYFLNDTWRSHWGGVLGSYGFICKPLY